MKTLAALIIAANMALAINVATHETAPVAAEYFCDEDTGYTGECVLTQPIDDECFTDSCVEAMYDEEITL